jgi:hypothetical protein
LYLNLCDVKSSSYLQMCVYTIDLDEEPTMRVAIMKIQMLVQRVKVDLGGRIIKKQKIACLRPHILQMLVMKFPAKGILRK